MPVCPCEVQRYPIHASDCDINYSHWVSLVAVAGRISTASITKPSCCQSGSYGAELDDLLSLIERVLLFNMVWSSQQSFAAATLINVAKIRGGSARS